MKKLTLPLLASLLILNGCAHEYLIRLNNGTKITTATKPKLQHGFYVFKDAKGKEVHLPQGHVAEIAPASMAAEGNPNFTPPSKR